MRSGLSQAMREPTTGVWACTVATEHQPSASAAIYLLIVADTVFNLILRDRSWNGWIAKRRAAAGASETGTHLELEAFQTVARLGVERLSITQLERTDRRNPADPQTRRIAQFRGAHFLAFLVDLAGVDETEPAQAAVAARTGERHLQLGVADQAFRAAQRIVGGRKI